jgi:CBS-domain-containing membrane protein
MHSHEPAFRMLAAHCCCCCWTARLAPCVVPAQWRDHLSFNTMALVGLLMTLSGPTTSTNAAVGVESIA